MASLAPVSAERPGTALVDAYRTIKSLVASGPSDDADEEPYQSALEYHLQNLVSGNGNEIFSYQSTLDLNPNFQS